MVVPATSLSAPSRGVELALRHPRRINVTLPDALYWELMRLSLEQGRSLSNLAAYWIELSLKDC